MRPFRVSPDEADRVGYEHGEIEEIDGLEYRVVIDHDLPDDVHYTYNTKI